jgi:hypothetical protein
MADRCIELMEDEKSLAFFRKNAFLQAKRFDINHVLPEYEQYYMDIIERNKSITV